MRRAARLASRTAIAAVAAYAAVSVLATSIRPLSAAQPPGAGQGSDAPAGREQRVDTVACAKRAIAANEIALLDFRGEIPASFENDRVYATLNQVASNPRIAAIALRIDSSGGDSYGAKKLHQALRKLRTACAVPMAAFIGNVGTSGAFWLAMAADEIHADPLSTVGGVGVLATYVNEREKLEREGIRYSVIRTGDRKWPLMPYLPVDGADVQKIKDSLDIVLAEFVAAIEDARKAKLKLTREQLTSGEAWMGRDAFGLGLVDGPEEIDAFAVRHLGSLPAAYRFFSLSPERQPAGPRDAKDGAAVAGGSARRGQG